MYGVIETWGNEEKITWYDTLSQAFNNASNGDIVIKQIEEIK